MTPEAKVKAAVKKELDKAGVWYFMPAANGYGRAGIPDIICCINGYFLAIECKAERGKTTALQERELGKIKDAGGTALAITAGSRIDFAHLGRALFLLSKKEKE